MHQREQPILRVEGTDDKHAIRHLLLRHGIDTEHLDIAIKGSEREGEDSGGRDKMLQGMALEVKTSTGKSIGYVLDADRAAEDRWRSVQARIGETGLELPDPIPEDGFVGYSSDFQTRVGVWLMPDNRRAGALEGFLQDLVPERDILIQLAEKSTDKAKNAGAEFPDTARMKAILHTWLAWQKCPGVPYGTAIKAKYFQSDSPAARAFVDWFRRVFEIPSP